MVPILGAGGGPMGLREPSLEGKGVLQTLRSLVPIAQGRSRGSKRVPLQEGPLQLRLEERIWICWLGS